MVKEQLIQIATWAALGALALGVIAEVLHARRIRRLAHLAFGPVARPRRWTIITPPLRVFAYAGLVWSLVILLSFEGSGRQHERTGAATRHLMILLDVSPSMTLKDAGADGSQTRRARAADLLKSVMERANNEQTRISLACFYSDALMLAKDCADRELIWNFADDLPLHMAFKPGKTSVITSLNTTGTMLKAFPRKSVTLLVLTDGDTLPATGLTPMPSAVAETLVVGVGSTSRGTFIDGHLSRQDNASLSQLARRLGGQYFDGNTKQVPSSLLKTLTADDESKEKFHISLRTLAIGLLAASATLLCLLPMLLEKLGSGWRPLPPTRTVEVPS